MPSPMPSPPPGCPMHNSEDKQAPPPIKSTMVTTPSENTTSESKLPPSGCPMHNKLNNEENQIHLQQRQDNQEIELPTERVISSIPKSKDTDQKWEYPSPQQFYNALRRKGWETPEEHIESMVDIHNFLNEEAWEKVLKWENKFDCECNEDPYLIRFQGRPQEISPKARWHMWWHGAPKPFDRHDWYVSRCGQVRRYVIDYYEAPEEIPGVPVFNLDIRPALDDFPSIMARFKEGFKNKWDQVFNSESS
ncbi:unnamed protein product [Cunninghamella blakesleeana]